MYMMAICAYPVNVDAIYDFCAPEISELARGVRAGAIEKIESPRDLISALLLCMKSGSGAEILIEDKSTAQRIGDLFSWRYRLGGNAGIMANVLAGLGAAAILNAPALSPRLAGMLDPRVRVPLSGSLQEPWRAARGEDMIHYVFQFAASDSLVTDEERIRAPRSNRLIATYDPVNARLESSRDFDEFCLQEIRRVDGAIVSGFHLVPLGSYKAVLDRKIRQIRSWKEGNSRIFVHAEMGSFQRPEIMEHLLKHLYADSIGFNEDELGLILRVEPGWSGIAKAAGQLKEELGFSRIAVHTQDFILSVTDGRIGAEDEQRALSCGVEAAASVAASGFVGDGVVRDASPAGLRAKEEFCRQGGTPLGRGAYADVNGTVTVLVPSAHVACPRFTVGLGDTATAAVFHAELCALGKRS